MRRSLSFSRAFGDCRQQAILGCTRVFVFLLVTTFTIPLLANETSVESKGTAASEPDPLISRGRKLFEQDFRYFDDFALTSDGVGPMFNQVSCIACHHQGALGGGGDLKHNVDIISFTQKTLERHNRAQLGLLHPAFTSSGDFVPSLLLHRYSTDSRYPEMRKNFLGKSWVRNDNDNDRLRGLMKRKPARKIEPQHDVFMLHTQRNTPAVFGSGLLEAISDETLKAQAAKKKKFGVKGRVSQLPGQKIGRFGWRAQLPTVKSFVLAACANELGLDVEDHSQATNPIDPNSVGDLSFGKTINTFKSISSLADTTTIRRPFGSLNNPISENNQPEISIRDTDAMVSYICNIKQPNPVVPAHVRKAAVNGLKHFKAIGCTECHVQDMGPAKNVFSDLLLHDMGKRLSDPVGASREREFVSTPNRQGRGRITSFQEPKFIEVYYVGTVTVPRSVSKPNEENPYMDVVEKFAETNVDRRQEWRTPPLWGCADSAPYMHDGRAATLEEAIDCHQGESKQVRQNYLALSKEERKELLTFLSCLKAPKL